MKNLKEWRQAIEDFILVETLYLETNDLIDGVFCNSLDVGFGESSILIKGLYPQTKLLDYVQPHPDYLKGLFPDGRVTGLDYQLDISQTFLQEECDKYYGKFDLIFALDVLEHVKKPWVAATNLANMLTHNGHLFLSVPSLGIEHHPSKFGRYPDLWRFFEGSLSELFCGCFDVNKVFEETYKLNGQPIGIIAIFQRKYVK